MRPIDDVTQILAAVQEGDPKAADQLLPLVCEELRKLAMVRMANEKTGTDAAAYGSRARVLVETHDSVVAFRPGRSGLKDFQNQVA